jgi:hypothetical protein
MIKIIYPYRFSQWNELKYSIRSIEKHFKNPYQIWIMGDVPSYLNRNKLINIQTYNKNFKQINKCRLFDLSQMLQEDEEFIWMNDDIYLTNDITIDTLRIPRYLENLNGIKNRGKRAWHIKLWKTADFLSNLGYTIYNFECHIPTLYKVSNLIRTFERFQELDVWTMNTAYYNYNKCIDNLELVDKDKLGIYKNNENISYDLKNYLFLNHNDNGLSLNLKNTIRNTFPKKSNLEI